jgi:phospholipid transport system substrate-binding protein
MKSLVAASISAERVLRLCLALSVAGIAAAGAALPAGPQDNVRSFYSVLLQTMQNARALGESGRYAALSPVVHRVFDLAVMARLAVGPAWDGLTSIQREQVTGAFGRYVTATYADRFDGYSGERLEITGERSYGAGVVVQTKIAKPGSDPVELDYLMRQNQGSWQISDVYLDGTISQLATQRSEFQSILRRQGVDGLISALNRKVDLLTRNVARSR